MVKIRNKSDYKQHVLKDSPGSYIPANWLFLDTETLPKVIDSDTVHFFNIGWTCLWIRQNGKGHGHTDWQFFDNELSFNKYLDFIATKMTNIIFAGHNIFFDLQACGFFDYFPKHGWYLEFYYDKGLTYILKCRKGRSKITVISTTNWFDQSLKLLGESLKMPKLEVDFETVTPEKLKIYCRRDVEIIVRAMRYYIKFIQDHDLGRFSLTKASQAFTAFRHRFMTHKIMIHNNDETHELERGAYIGGRVEAFYIGHCKGGPFVSMDINSMYPYVMKENLYPWSLISSHRNESPERYNDILKTFAVVAEIEVETPEACFAVRYNKKTIFPVGHFTCFVCSTGLQYALDRGYVKNIIRSAIYRKADLFTSYVDYFYDLRRKYTKSQNKIMTVLSKYMHNSLYGKFGQMKMISDITDKQTGRDYLREDSYNMVTQRKVVITHFMNMQIVQYPEGEGDNSNVAIAAHISENARFMLWSIIKDVGLKRVLYCDTDSVKIRASHLKYLHWPKHSYNLGALKCEDRSKQLYIEGCKNYRTENSRKIKGIPKKAKEIKPGVFVFESFSSQTIQLRNEISKGVTIKSISRSLRAPYDKGVVLKSGVVRPLKFPIV